MKEFVSQTIDSLDVGPMKVHVGLVTYGETASTILKMDQLNAKDAVQTLTNGITQQGNEVNEVSAIDEAFHVTFTIFGGVREAAPKEVLKGSQNICRHFRQIAEIFLEHFLKYQSWQDENTCTRI